MLWSRYGVMISNASPSMGVTRARLFFDRSTGKVHSKRPLPSIFELAGSHARNLGASCAEAKLKFQDLSWFLVEMFLPTSSHRHSCRDFIFVENTVAVGSEAVGAKSFGWICCDEVRATAHLNIAPMACVVVRPRG